MVVDVQFKFFGGQTMRSIVTPLVLCVAVAGVAYAQDDAFNGTWKLNVAKSSGRNLPKEEIVVIKVADNEQYKSGTVTEHDGSVHKSDYTAKYNDGKWYPTKNQSTGKPAGDTMMIRFDPRHEVRFMKRPNGDSSSFLLRAVSADGKTMTVTSIGLDGKTGTVWVFEKQ
jgi:hypothetical protein